jgi:two-component system NtrC family response regulator/two-component system response regulator AtoC
MSKTDINILIVDDSEETALMLSILLKQSLNGDYTYHLAYSAEEALKLLEASFFHLVITDIEMPGANGISLCQTIYEQYPYTVVIMVSGKADMKYPIESLRSGAFDYVTKPIAIPEFISVVERALSYQTALMKRYYCEQALAEDIHGFFEMNAHLRSMRSPKGKMKSKSQSK